MCAVPALPRKSKGLHFAFPESSSETIKIDEHYDINTQSETTKTYKNNQRSSTIKYTNNHQK
jgi:hypothetical protein